MQFLEDYIRNSMPEDWSVSLELISSKEAVAFYEKFGFEANEAQRLKIFHHVE